MITVLAWRVWYRDYTPWQGHPVQEYHKRTTLAVGAAQLRSDANMGAIEATSRPSSRL